MQKPSPVSLLHLRVAPFGHRPAFVEELQHRSPRSPHGSHAPALHTLPTLQEGSRVRERWQHGSPVRPQDSQRPAPVWLLHRRSSPSGQNPELAKSAEGQHGWPSCPQPPDCMQVMPVLGGGFADLGSEDRGKEFKIEQAMHLTSPCRHHRSTTSVALVDG
jgi:hypothetical protein